MGKKSEYKADDKISLTSFLAAKVAGLSRAKADILVKSGEVRVNGARVKTNVKLDVGDSVSVFVPSGMTEDVPLKVIYDDDNIVVFDKPKHTAYDALQEKYGKMLYAVHRLDTNTTGVIVFAKTEEVRAELERAFSDRRTHKVYEAAVYPAPKSDSATLTAYTEFKNGTARVSPSPFPGGKTMVTEYKVIERIGRGALIKVVPHTGRTHQIRAHMSYIGSPIVGDPKYGVGRGDKDGQMLTAVELTFFGLGGELSYLNGKTFKAERGFDAQSFCKMY